ncbi:hypothetical protein JP0532_07110 [Helicobacter pylori]
MGRPRRSDRIQQKGQGHFIGTMVVAKNEDNKKLYDIIDRPATNDHHFHALACLGERAK